MNYLYFAEGTTLCTSDGNIPIDKLSKTGEIRTYDGSYIPFIFYGKQTKYPTVIVTFSNDQEIICTSDIQFLGQQGWVRVNDSIGVCVYDYSHECDVSIKGVRVGGVRNMWKIGIDSENGLCLGNGIIVYGGNDG